MPPKPTGRAEHEAHMVHMSPVLTVLPVHMILTCSPPSLPSPVYTNSFFVNLRKHSENMQRLQQKPPAEAPPDADVVELVAPRSGSDMGGKWEPDVRVPPTVATLR